MQDSGDDVAKHILETIPVVMQALRREIHQHRTRDISVPQFRLLGYVHRCPGASLSEAADFLGLSLPTVSVMVDNLVVHNLVSRQTHPQDRRRITLRITGEGHDILSIAHEATKASLSEMLSTLTNSERKALDSALVILNRTFTPDCCKKNPL